MSGPRPLFEPDPPAGPLAQVAEPAPLTVTDGPGRAAFELPDIPPDEPFAGRVHKVRAGPVTVAESTIVEELLRWLAVQPRVHARKVHQTAVTGSGEPDLDICWRGRAVKIEVKRVGETPTRVQLRRLLTWREAGALAGWVTSLDDLRRILEHVDDRDWRADLTVPGG